MWKCLSILLVTLVSVVPSHAETVTIAATRDATLIEDPNGALGNGSGSFFFVGRTGQAEGAVRRSLLQFRVADVVPRDAIIESVSLTVFLWSSNPETRDIRVHRVLADWGEGESSSAGGSGAPSSPGDATWVHSFYPSESWTRAGGDFLGRVSASLDVGDTGFYTWHSTNHLVQDVRLWKTAPRRNFGWILIGDESSPQTAKSFASREHPDLVLRPVLEVQYRLPGDSRGR